MKRVRSSDGPLPPKRRGGIRQRRERQAREEALPQQSVLAVLLLQLFAWGDISAQLAQKIADAAYKDANSMKAAETDLGHLQKIASVGCGGQYQNKCYSDLMKNLPMRIHIPVPTLTKLPFSCGDLLQGLLLPHEMFSALHHHYPSAWSKFVVPSQERLESFWRTNSLHPSFAARNLDSRPEYRRFCVPLSLHGDDVPVVGVGKAWCALLTVFSWTSMCGLGSTKESQFFIWGCWEKLRKYNLDDQAQDTLGSFFKVLVWSLQWLERGQWPDRDWQGKMQLGANKFGKCSIYVNQNSLGCGFVGQGSKTRKGVPQGKSLISQGVWSLKVFGLSRCLDSQGVWIPKPLVFRLAFLLVKNLARRSTILYIGLYGSAFLNRLAAIVIIPITYHSDKTQEMWYLA